MKQLAKAFFLFKLAWFRCLLYALVVGWSEFEHLTETWSQATWDNTGKFELVRLFGHTIFGGVAGVILAFLDQTVTNIRNGRNPIPTGDTNPPFPIEHTP